MFRRNRSGSASTPIILVCSIAAVAFLVWWYMTAGGNADGESNGNILRPGATTHTITTADLVVSVTEDANLESASNVEVKCQVQGGTTILSIVEDGKEVKKGDLLVELDQSRIDEAKIAQEGVVERAKATKIQAEQDAEAAKIAIKEYEQGLFVQNKQIAESNIIIAKKNVQTAKNLLAHTRKMARKGFATPTQVEADEFAVQRSDLELQAAETAKDVLVNFTFKKMMKQLEAAHEAAIARSNSELKAFQLEENKLAKLEEQFKACKIYAPQDGMVVFANEKSRYGSIQIEEGGAVRESQTILRIPNLNQMQAKVLVNESKIKLLKNELTARIKVQGRTYNGRVIQIANQPEPKSWFTAQVKEYATVVAIDGKTAGLKPGMTAEVEITIVELPDQLVIPVAAVVEQGRRHFCWVKTENGVEKRTLKLKRNSDNAILTDDKVIAVDDGVAINDVVILNPRAVVPEAKDDLAKEAEKDAELEAADQKKRPRKSNDATDKSGSKSRSDGKQAGARTQPTGNSGGQFKLPTFAESDKNGDGKITKDETSGRASESFDKNDTNGDGHIDKAEHAAVMAKIKAMIQARQNQQQPGGPQ